MIEYMIAFNSFWTYNLSKKAISVVSSLFSSVFFTIPPIYVSNPFVNVVLFNQT